MKPCRVCRGPIYLDICGTCKVREYNRLRCEGWYQQHRAAVLAGNRVWEQEAWPKYEAAVRDYERAMSYRTAAELRAM